MLTGLTIKNFRCFRNVSVPLRPLTVLIGKNDTGKTSFLRAIEALAEYKERLKKADHWNLAEDSIEITAQLDDASVRFFEVIKEQFGTLDNQARQRFTKKRQQEQEKANRYVLPVSRHCLSVAGMPYECAGVPDRADAPDVGGSGESVPAVLDYLMRRSPEVFGRINSELALHIDSIKRVGIATPKPEVRRLYFTTTEDVEIDGGRVSSGVLLLLFFLVLAHHPNRPKVVMIEEPENGVHPRRLQNIVELLKKVATGDLGGQATQVILTTHSPYLLDCINPSEDQVLVFSRNDEDGSRIAQPVDEEKMQLFLDEFRLGEVWYNRQEEGLVGVPG